jgi:hypothetical protein
MSVLSNASSPSRKEKAAEIRQEDGAAGAGRCRESLRVQLIPGDVQHLTHPFEGEPRVLDGGHCIVTALRAFSSGPVEVSLYIRTGCWAGAHGENLSTRADVELYRAWLE